MPLEAQSRFPVMCLTQDGTGVSHADQAARLCAAGARWIQLRMKASPEGMWREEACAAARVCRAHGAIFIVNDRADIALASGADGVHLGEGDGAWAEARRLLGPERIVGGTVNSSGDVARAAASGCLDYAGVGPLRFTSTKRKLAPVLGLFGVRRLIAELGGIPAWVIGGVVSEDLPALREAGAAGVAVSSALYRAGQIEKNLEDFLIAWPPHAKQRIPAALP